MKYHSLGGTYLISMLCNVAFGFVIITGPAKLMNIKVMFKIAGTPSLKLPSSNPGSTTVVT